MTKRILRGYGRNEILNKAFLKFYSPSERLAVDEVIILLKGKVIFRPHIPKKKTFNIKIYKTCR